VAEVQPARAAWIVVSLTATRIKDPEINNDPDPSKHIQVTYSQPNILTSRITPSLFFNSLNASIDPTAGKSLFLGLAFSGGFLGGDVNTIAPSLEFKMFSKVARRRSEKATRSRDALPGWAYSFIRNSD
jgi:hypothetical protein